MIALMPYRGQLVNRLDCYCPATVAWVSTLALAALICKQHKLVESQTFYLHCPFADSDALEHDTAGNEC